MARRSGRLAGSCSAGISDHAGQAQVQAVEKGHRHVERGGDHVHGERADEAADVLVGEHAAIEHEDHEAVGGARVA